MDNEGNLEVGRYMQDANGNRLGGTIEVADEFNGFAHLMNYYEFVTQAADEVMGEADASVVPEVVH